MNWRVPERNYSEFEVLYIVPINRLTAIFIINYDIVYIKLYVCYAYFYVFKCMSSTGIHAHCLCNTILQLILENKPYTSKATVYREISNLNYPNR